MSTWNYRILRTEATNPDGTTEPVFELIEAYYDDKGRPNGYCPAQLTADSVLDLVESLHRMAAGAQQHLTKRNPPLTPEDFTSKAAKP